MPPFPTPLCLVICAVVDVVAEPWEAKDPEVKDVVGVWLW